MAAGCCLEIAKREKNIEEKVGYGWMKIIIYYRAQSYNFDT